MQGLIGQLSQTPTNVGVPFRTAEEAWFWFICAVEAREAGAIPSRAKAAVQRPCEPMDIYRTLERLHRNRRLRVEHIKVLSHYALPTAQTGSAPTGAPDVAAMMRDPRYWQKRDPKYVAQVTSAFERQYGRGQA